MTGVPRDLCPASSAKLSARHSGAATQRNWKLCSARPSRCRKAWKDWSSVKLTSGHPQLSLEGPTWHTQTSIHLHLHFIHHPSWSILIIIPSLILIRPPSSVIHLHAIMLPSFINHHACIQIKNAKRHPSARLEHHAADETSNLPNAGHWNVAILQRKAAPHCPRTHFLRHNHHMGSHWDQIVSLIQKIILEGPWFLVISWCSILFNHYMTMCRILHMMCDKNDINWYHIGFGPPRYPRLEVVPLFLQLENRFLDKPTSFTCNPGRKCDAGPGFGTSFSALVHLI